MIKKIEYPQLSSSVVIQTHLLHAHICSGLSEMVDGFGRQGDQREPKACIAAVFSVL